MTRTSDLIETLVASAGPVRRLRPPLVRAGLWLGFAAVLLVLIAIGHGVRADLVDRLNEARFVTGIAGALVTAILAAAAAFAMSLPDRSQRWLLLPLPAVSIWVATIGYGCIADWVGIGPDGVRLGETLRCFATLVFTSVPLAIALTVMLRYAALLRAGKVALMGGLAVAAITSAALSLFHPLDATVMILVWNLGTAALITGLAGLFGRPLLGFAGARMLPSDPSAALAISIKGN